MALKSYFERTNDTSEAGTVKAPWLLLSVIGVHVAAVSSFLLISGCGTTQPIVEPPPAPIMPPNVNTPKAQTTMPRPQFNPPVDVEQASITSDIQPGDTYTIQKGDSLSKIAVRHGVGVREIADLNNLKNPNAIRAGQKIILPSHAKKVRSSPPPTSKPSAAAPSTSSARASSSGDYTVKAGDSLSKIAANNGTTVKALKDANGLTSDMIRVGQKLAMPGSAAQSSVSTAAGVASSSEPAPAVEAAPPAQITTSIADDFAASIDAPPPSVDDAALPDNVPFPYTVKDGESLGDIARNFGVLQDDIMKLNGITDPAAVTPGTSLKIPWQ